MYIKSEDNYYRMSLHHVGLGQIQIRQASVFTC